MQLNILPNFGLMLMHSKSPIVQDAGVAYCLLKEPYWLNPLSHVWVSRKLVVFSINYEKGFLPCLVKTTRDIPFTP